MATDTTTALKPTAEELKAIADAKAVANQYGEKLELLAACEAEPELFAADAADKLRKAAAALDQKFNAFPMAVRVKAMAFGKRLAVIGERLEKAFKLWYPTAYATACEEAGVDKMAAQNLETNLHAFTFTGYYDHKGNRVVQRNPLASTGTRPPVVTMSGGPGKGRV